MAITLGLNIVSNPNAFYPQVKIQTSSEGELKSKPPGTSDTESLQQRIAELETSERSLKHKVKNRDSDNDRNKIEKKH